MIELEDEILEDAIEKYGEDDQLRQAMGECGELIAACQNYYRSKTYGYRTETLEVVIEEAVDVFFMIQQIRWLDPELFDKLCELKKFKVLKKLEEENPKQTMSHGTDL